MKLQNLLGPENKLASAVLWNPNSPVSVILGK